MLLSEKGAYALLQPKPKPGCQILSDLLIFYLVLLGGSRFNKVFWIV